VSSVTQDDLDEYFTRFINQKAIAYSETYTRLARAAATDPVIRGIAASAHFRPVVDLLFACVQRRIRTVGRSDLLPLFETGLSAYPDDGKAVAAFIDFCHEEEHVLKQDLRWSRLQTNEPGRCTALVLGLAAIHERLPGEPIHLVDLGASAGLHLNFDRYAYEFAIRTETVELQPASPSQLTVTTRVHGYRVDELPSAIPLVGSRVGVDIAPLDVRDHGDRLWLESFLWPDEPNRRSRLRRAITIARQWPPPLVGGDVVEVLPEVLRQLPEGLICVFNSHAAGQFPPAAAAALDALIAPLVTTGRCVRLTLEGGRSVSLPVPQHTKVPGSYSALTVTDRAGVHRIALAGSHGGWIEKL
jgi:hypothetical protein